MKGKGASDNGCKASGVSDHLYCIISDCDLCFAQKEEIKPEIYIAVAVYRFVYAGSYHIPPSDRLGDASDWRGNTDELCVFYGRLVCIGAPAFTDFYCVEAEQ